MRTGAAAGHRGFFHETACYGSDDDFVALTVPFVEAGLAAGEPTVLALDRHNHALVAEALGDDLARVIVLPASGQYARPAATIAAFRGLFADLTAEGAAQVRIVGDVPHTGTGALWDPWARYEAAANLAYDDFPVWGLCPYDTRTTPVAVLDEVARTHPRVASIGHGHAGNGHTANTRFEEPAAFLGGRPPAGPDPIESAAPAAVVAAPSPRAARAAVAEVAASTGLGADRVNGLVLALSEVVTNALVHGEAPVTVRAWPSEGRIHVTVTDAGPGPADPFVGLLHRPGAESIGGHGLWFAHQLCHQVTMGRDAAGFTVRLTVWA